MGNVYVRLSGGPAPGKKFKDAKGKSMTKEQVKACIREQERKLNEGPHMTLFHIVFVDSGKADYVVIPNEVSQASKTSMGQAGDGARVMHIDKFLAERNMAPCGSTKKMSRKQSSAKKGSTKKRSTKKRSTKRRSTKKH